MEERDIVLPLISIFERRAHHNLDLNVFGPFLLTGGGPPYDRSYVHMPTSFKYFKLGYGSAISTIILAINLILASVYMKLARRGRA